MTRRLEVANITVDSYYYYSLLVSTCTFYLTIPKYYGLSTPQTSPYGALVPSTL